MNAAALLDTGRQPHAAGALYATVEDLYKWDQALYTDKLLPDDLKQKLFTSNLQYYGYGWAIRSISSAPYSSKKVVQKPMMEAKGDALRESCANQK